MTRRTPFLLAAGLLAVTTTGCAVKASSNARDEDRLFPYSASTLVIEARGTRVRLEPGTAGTVRVRRTLKGTPAEEGNASWSLEGGRLKVGVTCSGIVLDNCESRHTVMIPPGVAVEVDSDQNVSAVRLAQSLKVRAGDGDVHTRAISGPLDVVTTSGKVDLEAIRSPKVTARSSDGKLNLGFDTPPTEVEAVSGSGTVTIVLPKTADAYRVRVSSRNGQATTRVPESRDAKRSLVARSDDGNVRVRHAT
ncbi:DUF4097 family beta strand repeat-containing protein [Streptosporangium sp. NPDC050855]|uniref:DUF4097 family beta strand repeat-containing protein n=1 Tax=Streptosporangium sp. NPDC050855 TaxID=3366194 RepID=UPI00378C1BA9